MAAIQDVSREGDSNRSVTVIQGLAQRCCGLPLYALINPVLQDYPDKNLPITECNDFDALSQMRSEAWQDREVFVARSESPLIDIHRLPYLVALQGPRDPLLLDLIENAEAEHQAALSGATVSPYRTGILLETSLPADQLMVRLDQMWRFHAPGSQSARYLNWADRRVAEALCAICDPEQIAQWLGPIARMHVLTRYAFWVTQRGAADETTFSEEQHFHRAELLNTAASTSAKLTPTRPQHQQIQALRAISLALTAWQRHGDWSEDIHLRAWQGVQAAEAQGIQSLQEQAEFAWRWMHDPASVRLVAAADSTDDTTKTPAHPR